MPISMLRVEMRCGGHAHCVMESLVDLKPFRAKTQPS